MALTDEQRDFFWENGYLPYHRILSDEDLTALRKRSAVRSSSDRMRW